MIALEYFDKFDSLDCWVACLEQAQLDWKVQVQPLYYAAGPGEQLSGPCKSARVIVSDNPLGNQPEEPRYWELGSCGPTWTPLQNEVLMEQAIYLLTQRKGLAVGLKSAGSYDRRKHVWVELVDIPRWFKDEQGVDFSLVLTNSHDGLKGVKILIVPTCRDNNTVLGPIKATQELKHTPNIVERIRTLTSTFDSSQAISGIMTVYQGLKDTEMTRSMFDRYITAVLSNYSEIQEIRQLDESIPVETRERIRRTERQMEQSQFPGIRNQIIQASETAPGARDKGTYGTAWGAYNAVLYWANNCRKTSTQGEGRIANILFDGNLARVATRAFELLV